LGLLKDILSPASCLATTQRQGNICIFNFHGANIQTSYYFCKNFIMLEKFVAYFLLTLSLVLGAVGLVKIVELSARVESLEKVVENYRTNSGQMVDSLGNIVKVLDINRTDQAKTTARLKKELIQMEKGLSKEIENRTQIWVAPIIPEMDTVMNKIKNRINKTK
jgi:hypothetical protein